MRDFLVVLALAMMPAAGNFAGGLLAEAVRVSERTLSLALHAAAGVVLAVVAVELLPEAFATAPAWIVIFAFIAGGAFYMGVDWAIERISGGRRKTGEAAAGTVESAGAGAGPWMIFFSVAVDLFSDGVMIGAGSTVSLSLGLLLALGQVIGDVPEGFATIATFKGAGTPRRTRLLLSAGFAVPVLLGAAVGYWAVRGRPEAVQYALLAFTAGTLTTVAVEEIVPEAHKGEETRWATVCFIGGFALFALLSTYLG